MKLYKRTKTGAVQQWAVRAEGDTITVEFGQAGGKLREKSTTCEGKNIGRANETTPEQQAVLEADSKYRKQLKAGYVVDPSGESDLKLPMKIKNYKDNTANVVFPCYGSPKLNGVNATFRLTNTGLILTSRGGEQYPVPPHQIEPVTKALHKLGTMSLNGEIYLHGAWLEDITGATKKHNELTENLEFWAFELPDVAGPFSSKIELLQGCGLKTPGVAILNSHEEIRRYHVACVNAGYEGIVIRNAHCVYQYGTRSSDAFKFKIPESMEFKIRELDRVDKNDHPVIWIVNPQGKDFKVKPKGTAEQKLKILAQFEERYRGQWYTVEFESWSKYGVPLKPVGIGLRKCNEEGKPLE
jgi:DNA ligase-1